MYEFEATLLLTFFQFTLKGDVFPRFDEAVVAFYSNIINLVKLLWIVLNQPGFVVKKLWTIAFLVSSHLARHFVHLHFS